MPPRADLPDEELLDELQCAAFGYFVDTVNPTNGLIADTSREGSPCSIAVVGLALLCYAIGVMRGRMSREDAVDRVLTTLARHFNEPDDGEREIHRLAEAFYHRIDFDAITGIHVDFHLRTANARVFAAGDICCEQ